MKIYNELIFTSEGEKHSVQFGIPDNQRELDLMFQLRFAVYRKHGYFSEEYLSNGIDYDNYDKEKKCVYFIAMINNEILGTARLIKAEYLPTEKDCFEFEEPEIIKSIPRNNRAELGRLIAINKFNIPRHLTMSFLIKTATDYSEEVDIRGGYSFIKSKLEDKLSRLGIPFHPIRPFKLIYPRDGILSEYFNQKDDPAIPMVFITKEISKKINQRLNNKIFFKKLANQYILRHHLYNFFLRYFVRTK